MIMDITEKLKQNHDHLSKIIANAKANKAKAEQEEKNKPKPA